MLSTVAIQAGGCRNTGEHSERAQLSLGSRASFAYVFSWLNFRRPTNQPKHAKLTSKLADEDDACNAAGGYMAEHGIEFCEQV